MSWVKVTEDDLVADAAEQALNDVYDCQVNEFYKEAKSRAEALRRVYDENCIENLFGSEKD